MNAIDINGQMNGLILGKMKNGRAEFRPSQRKSSSVIHHVGLAHSGSNRHITHIEHWSTGVGDTMDISIVSTASFWWAFNKVRICVLL